MKKTILSIVATTTTLIAFGLLTFFVIARPAGSAPTQEVAETGSNLAYLPFAAEAVVYEINAVTYDWIDISGVADEEMVPTEFEDNLGSAAIEIGFYFPFFDNVYETVSVSDNGYIYFGGDEAAGGNTPQAIPAAEDGIHNLIAPLGADLFRNPGDSAVYIARQTSPERRLVIQFEQAYWCCNLENSLDFQIVLYPDGRILTQYQTIGGDSSPHAYVTVGLENEAGTSGHTLYTGFLDETDQLADETAYLYDPGDTILGQLRFLPPDSESETVVGEEIEMTADFLNLSGVEATFTTTLTLQINGQPVEIDQSDWAAEILTEPDTLTNTQFSPLTVAVISPAEATAGDTALVTATTTSADLADLSAVADFTIIIGD